MLAACLLLAIPAIVERLASIDSLTPQLAYLGLLAAMWAALVAGAYAPFALARWIMAALLAFAGYFFAVYTRVTTQFMSYDAFINMMNSAGFAGEALVQNRSAFLAEIAPALLLLVAIGIKPRRRPPLAGLLLTAAPVLGTGLLTGLLFIRGGEGARGLPGGFTPIAYLALSTYEEATGVHGPRQEIALPLEHAADGNIVLIVDESIAATYLDINDPAGVPTPLSRDWPGVAIHNYGIAASITTCSVGSNLTLRYGGTRGAYQRINATMPSIWAYARKAGLHTVYLDAQRSDGALQNLMDGGERALIDSFVQFGDVPVEQRDQAVASELVRQLADPAPKFILVNKLGAHFPVHDKFPASAMRFTPALPRGQFTNITDTGSRDGFDGSAEDWRRYRNSYRNTLLWNVGTFFDTVLREGDLSRTTMIYTADHGQDLHENGKPGLFTHCSAYPMPEEGAVPLVVLAGSATPAADWTATPGNSAALYSHYEIFPSLLQLMGYRPDAVVETYGASLSGTPADPGTFNALFNARLNRDPVWVPVRPDGLARPPLADYRQPAK